MLPSIITRNKEIVGSQKYLDVDLPTERLITVTSPMGSGKSTWISKNIVEGAVYLTPRIALGSQMAIKYNAVFYKEERGDIKGDKIVISADSLPRLIGSDDHFNKTIVIDEYGLFSKHLNGHTCKHNRIYILQMLKIHLRNAKQIILLDAHHYPDAVQFFQELGEIKEEETVRIINEYNPRDLRFLKYPDKHSLTAQIYKDAVAGRKGFVACDTKEEVKVLGAKLAEIDGLRILTVHGENSANVEQQRFINDVNKVQKEYDWVIASPSLSTGIDISEAHFEEVYLIANKYKATHQDLMQSVRRVRQVKTIRFWISSVVGQDQEDPLWLRRRHEASIEALVKNLGRTQDEDWETYAYDICPTTGKPIHRVDGYSSFTYQLEARVNSSLNNLLENFIDEAELVGRVGDAHGITSEESKTMKAAMKEIKSGLHEADIEKTLDAEPITEAGYDELNKKESLTEDEKWSVRRFKASQLCGFDDDLLTETVERLNEGLFKAVKLHRIRQSTDEALLAQDGEDLKFNHRKDVSFRKETKDLMRLLEMTLHMNEGAAGFQQRGSVLDEGRLITNDELGRFADVASTNRDKIKNLLGLSVPSDVRERPMQFLESYMRILGLELEFVSQPRINGKRVRQYSVSRQFLYFLL